MKVICQRLYPFSPKLVLKTKLYSIFLKYGIGNENVMLNSIVVLIPMLL